MKLRNKSVLITGATEGLGLSLTNRLIEKGCQVFGIARNIKVDFPRKQNLELFPCDVTNYQDLLNVVKKVGNIDILINNAGIWIEGKLQDNSVERISQVIDTNLKGVIYATKAVLPSMLEKNKGFIMNISSTSGLKGRSDQCVYVSSKYGVTGFTQSLQEDLKDTSIRVAGFHPGGMNTRLFEKAGNPKDNKGWMDTDKVAEIIIFMMERDESMVMDHVVLNRIK